MSNKIELNLLINFSIDKIRKDLQEYLSLSNSNLTIEVDVENTILENYSTTISIDDKLEFMGIRVNKSYIDIPVYPIIVEIIIGNYKINDSGTIDLEKCIAEFLYDDNLELIDIEFVGFW